MDRPHRRDDYGVVLRRILIAACVLVLIVVGAFAAVIAFDSPAAPPPLAAGNSIPGIAQWNFAELPKPQTIKARDGAEMKVKLADNPRIMAMVKASLADIKPNSYIGVTALPQPDGSQKAIAIHIFLESMRGTGEGHRPWDLRPGSTMTNAAVDTTVTGVNGQEVTVKYKDGEKKVVIPPETPIVAYAPGEKSEVKPGAQIIIMGATKQADGTYETPAINVGRGVTPPM